MGWILETNEAMNRAMEGMGGKIVRRYRLYEKAAEHRLSRAGAAGCCGPGAAHAPAEPHALHVLRGSHSATASSSTRPCPRGRGRCGRSSAASGCCLPLPVSAPVVAAAGGVVAGAAALATVRAVATAGS